MFFFTDTATTEIYTLSLHDALPISAIKSAFAMLVPQVDADGNELAGIRMPELSVPVATYTGWNLFNEKSGDRKSTRLNSSHSQISYAVFCLKKKKKKLQTIVYGYIS